MRAIQKAALFLALAITVPGAVTAQDIIPPGLDAFVANSTSYADFSGNPIPADFFGPGSDPFDGIIALEGEPLGPSPWCSGGWDAADLIVERLGPAEFPFIGAIDTVDIEIVELNLVSSVPIVVTYSGGLDPELWDVTVRLAPGQVPGSLIATLTHPDGGEFDLTLPVRPRFEFTQVDPPHDFAALDWLDLVEWSPVDPVPFHRIAPPDRECEYCASEDFFPGYDGTSMHPISFPDTFLYYDGEPACCEPPVIIPAGMDGFVSTGASWLDFSDHPLPADYFGPGSDPFDGIIAFTSEPIPPDGSCPWWDIADLGVERTELLVVELRCTPSDTIAVTVTRMAGVLEPFTVTFSGGSYSEMWGGSLDLAPVQISGEYRVTLTDVEGGVFDMTLPIKPRLHFAQLDPPFGTAGPYDWPEHIVRSTIDPVPFSFVPPPDLDCEDCASTDFFPATDGVVTYPIPMFPDTVFYSEYEIACIDTFHVNIPPGLDPYVTVDDAWFDISIPADFFGPGSDPFDGRVYFVGSPLGPDPSCPAGWESASVVIERLEPADLPHIGAIDTVAIEFVALNLVGVEPLVVTYNGGQNPEPWDITATLADVQSPGLLSLELFDHAGNDNTGTMIVASAPIAVSFGLDDGDIGTTDPYLDLGYSVLPINPNFLNPILPMGLDCEDCGAQDFVPGYDGTNKEPLLLENTNFRLSIETACLTGFPQGPADDVVTSLGSFTLWVYPQYRPLLDGCAGWDGRARWHSSRLFDPGTVVGRSAVHLDGDPTDAGGAIVGNGGWLVSDGDMTLRPPGFEGPPGTRELHTVLDLDLGDPTAPMRLRSGQAAPTRPISPGEIETDIVPGIDFPAESFFDVYFELDLDSCGAGFNDAIVYNTEPLLLMNGHVPGHPLEGLWVHGNSAPVGVRFATDDPGGMWLTGDTLGYLVKCGVGFSFDETPPYVTLFDSLMAGLEEIPVVLTAVEDVPRPQANYLDINCPNPFNPVTTIRYGLKEPAHVKLEIFNVAGQLVRTLVDEMQRPKAGGFAVPWNGTNNGGDSVASGVYFYRLKAGTFTKTRKMALLK